MPLPIGIRTTVETRGLEQARQILSSSLRGGLQGIGPLLQASVRSRARSNRGTERRDIRWEVTGRGLNLTLTVYATLVRTIIDELGLPPGTFPPFREGTEIFDWARSKSLDKRAERRQRRGYRRPKRERTASHLTRAPRTAKRRRQFETLTTVKRAHAARAEARLAKHGRPKRLSDKQVRALESAGFLIAREIFENGIKAGAPFSKALDANRRRIMRELENAVTRAVNRINRGG